jgi:hypothetical protein
MSIPYVYMIFVGPPHGISLHSRPTQIHNPSFFFSLIFLPPNLPYASFARIKTCMIPMSF